MAMTLITTNTSSGAANSAFTSSIDSTYKLYIFKIINANPATDDVNIKFNGSTDSGSNYNVTKTTTFFKSQHSEDDEDASIGYIASWDLAQSTAGPPVTAGIGIGSDEYASGTLWLFNPSNTTYVKHFYSTANGYHQSDQSWNTFVGGYFNTTAAITEIHFNCGSDFDAVIKMYGVG